MQSIVLEVARLDLNKVFRKSPQGFKDFRRLACHLLAVDTLEVFHVVWLHLERVHCLWFFALVAICVSRRKQNPRRHPDARQRTCSTQVAVWHVASSAADNAFEFPVINACTMPRQFVALSEANPALALVEKALQSLCDIMWIGREH